MVLAALVDLREVGLEYVLQLEAATHLKFAYRHFISPVSNCRQTKTVEAARIF
jgi:hypothetical protein